MLDGLPAGASLRKLRLFACACCRRVWGLLGDASRQCVIIAERFADGLAAPQELAAARQIAFEAYETNEGPAARKNAAGTPIAATERFGPGVHPLAMAGKAAASATDAWGAAHYAKEITYKQYYSEAEMLNCFLHDIFGSPFHPVVLEQSWLPWNDGAIRKLTQAIYDDRAFDRLPLLADALEDAGCTDPAILTHCRQPGEHVRGCWVVDLLLGKA